MNGSIEVLGYHCLLFAVGVITLMGGFILTFLYCHEACF